MHSGSFKPGTGIVKPNPSMHTHLQRLWGGNPGATCGVMGMIAPQPGGCTIRAQLHRHFGGRNVAGENLWIFGKTMLCGTLGASLLAGVAIPACAERNDKCRRDIQKAEHNLEQAVRQTRRAQSPGCAAPPPA
jgi:hypothetical protein